MSEYIKSKYHKNLIGRKAQIKHPESYCYYLWDKEGVITEVYGLLFLKFFTPAETMNGVYLSKNSYRLLEV